VGDRGCLAVVRVLAIDNFRPFSDRLEDVASVDVELSLRAY